MTEHTPGPWAVQWSNQDGYWITHDPRPADMKRGLRIIATLSASRKLNEQRADAVLIAAVPDLLGALQDLRFLFKQPGEDSIDAFERIADRFYRERGMLAPGKSQPLAYGGSPSDEERRAAYDEWLAAFQQRADAAIAKALGA